MRVPVVSIVLVNFNCGVFVDGVLRSLDTQDFRDFEVLVVDNGSTDGSIERLASSPGVRLMALGRNQGFSGALNAALRQTQSRYVLSLNFDVVLEPGFLGALVDTLEHHSDVGWAAGLMRRLEPDGVVNPDAIDCAGHHWLPSRYVYGYDPSRPAPEDYASGQDVFGASACAALYRREMLDDLAIAGEVFDEDLFAYFEDVDIDWRAQHRGYRCRYTPDARGAHMRGGSGAATRPEVAALVLSNRLLVMLKNDEFTHVLRDAWPILARTMRDIAGQARRHPRSLPIALSRLVRLAPAMWRKRRVVKARRRRAASEIRELQIATRFLG
jgi:GT2 family glycosyltransferase